MENLVKLSYKDPLAYRSVDIQELLHFNEDVIWIDRNKYENPALPTGADFHHYDDVPICKDVGITIQEKSFQNFILVRSNVILCGYRTYVGMGGTYNLDDALTDSYETKKYLMKLSKKMQFDNELTGFSQGNNDDSMNLLYDDREIIEINGCVISLTSDEAPNYGSFLIRILPKIIDVAKFTHDIKILVPLYFEGAIDYLHLCGIDPSRIIRHDVTKKYKIEKVIIPRIRNKEFWIDAESRTFYNSIRLRYGKSNSSTNKIYISRKSFQSSQSLFHNRVLINEEEVVNALEKNGYKVCYPETMPIHKQIQLFSAATHVIGPSGSGLFNVIFCHPGTKLIDIESEPHWVKNHVRLFGSLDLRFGIFEGDPSDRSFTDHHVPFRIDVSSLEEYLS